MFVYTALYVYMHVLFSHQQRGSRAHSNSGVSFDSHVLSRVYPFFALHLAPPMSWAMVHLLPVLRPGQDMAEIGQASGATRPWHPGRSSKEHGGEPLQGL